MSEEQFNLKDALKTYRDMFIELGPGLAVMEGLEKRIKEHIKETGEVAEVDGVKVSVRQGYTRKSWDSKKLEGYATAHPEIWDFCKESETAPSVSLKVK